MITIQYRRNTAECYLLRIDPLEGTDICRMDGRQLIPLFDEEAEAAEYLRTAAARDDLEWLPETEFIRDETYRWDDSHDCPDAEMTYEEYLRYMETLAAGQDDCIAEITVGDPDPDAIWTPLDDDEEEYLYILRDFDGYGSAAPVCVTLEEAERLCREWNDGHGESPEFDATWRKATLREVREYGISEC